MNALGEFVAEEMEHQEREQKKRKKPVTDPEKAIREAIDEIRGYYPEDIFPDPDESKDATKVPQAAVFKMARLTCDNIREAFERKLNEQKEN